MISQIPEWLHPGRFIDAKDKYGAWQVALVLTADKDRVKVRFDGWPPKYDEFFSIHSPKIKQFRSVVRGYTGQKKNAGVRDHMNYTTQILQEKFQELKKFIKDFQFHNADKITQYLRGQHYIFIDFLHTKNYKTVEEMKIIFQYFRLHFDITLRYLSDMTSIQPLINWFTFTDENQKAYSDSHFEIFDAVFTILGLTSRLRSFKVHNESKIKEVIAPQQDLNEYWNKFLQGIGFMSKFEQLLEKMIKCQDRSIPVCFIRSFLHLYHSLETICKDRQKKQKLAQILSRIIENECTAEGKQIEESDLQQIYDQIKVTFFKYAERQKLFRIFEGVRLNTWKNLILTENLDKKQKGIIKIREFFQSMISEKKQYLMIMINPDEFKLWIQSQKLLSIIFCLNQHQEVLKKGFELVEVIYEKGIIGFDELDLIWNACRHKIDTVRKILYSSFLKLITTMKVGDVEPFSRLLLEGELIEQIDIRFFYDTTHQIIVEDKSNEVNLKLLEFIFQRIRQNRGQINSFAHVLTYCDTKSNIWSKFLLQIFKNISLRVDVYFNLLVLNSIYSQVEAKILQIQDDFMHIIIMELKKTLEEKVDQNREEKVSLLLKCIHHLQEEYEIESEHISILWNLFTLPENQSLQSIFYNWILKQSFDPYFSLKVFSINSCIDFENKYYIFNSILRDPKNVDYINMKETEFEIFKQLMLEINSKDSKIVFKEILEKGGVSKYYRIVSSDLVGMKELWNIFLNCKNERVIYKVVNFLKDLYLKYHNKFSEKQKMDRTQGLFTKLEKNIKDGIKRSNIKLLKHSLIFVKELLYEIKEKSYFSHERHHHHTNKKIIKLKLPQDEVDEIKIEITAYLIELRKTISEKYKIPLENLTLVGNKQILKEENYLPIYLIHLPSNELSVFHQQNFIHELLIKFIQENLYAYLINILLDENSSKEAFAILTEIPQVKQAQEIIFSLMKFEKGKLNEKSIHFQMYMLMNVNRLSSEKLLEFSKTQFFSQISLLIENKISHQLEVELVKEALETSIKVWKKVKNHEIAMKDFERIPICLINVMEYINNEKRPNYKTITILHNCLQSFDLVYQEESINKLVQSEIFAEFLHKVFIECEVDYYKQATVKIIGEYLKRGLKEGALKGETEQKFYEVIFCQLYPKVIQINEKRKNFIHFFKLTKYVLNCLSSPILSKLFDGENKFWPTVLHILEQERDPIPHEQRNTLFQGHLDIAASAISKRSQLITTQFKEFIFFQCLIDDEKVRKIDRIKCRNRYSIQNALQILFKVCENSDDLCCFIPQIMKNQRTEYWRNNDFWNVDINMEIKSSTGYVGMENPGCICYLNSFMQILYMVPEFRDRIIGLNIIEEEGKNYEILETMKLLFLRLKYSNKKSISPTFFTRSIRTFDNKPMIKIYEQMDIDEYSSILFDKIESLLQKNNNFVQTLFEGVYSNEIISQECNHISQTEEKFLSLRLDVKNSIQESLNFLIKGETLEGENAYMCERCAKKVKALKRQSIKKLPDYLTICLKRFQYNYEIDQRIKLNNYCEFPSKLSLEEYSQQYLSKIEDPEEIHPKQYFQYELKGVVIHTGIVDSGHYYALIEGNDKKWYEFNDGFVSEFDEEKLADEAFGSKDEYDQKVKNAYLLMYKRVRVKEREGEMEVENSIRQMMTREKIEEINKENKQIQKFELFFNPEYQDNLIFYTKKLYHLSEGKIQTQQLLTQYFLQFCLLVKIRTHNSVSCIEALSFLENLLLNPQSEKVLLYFINILSNETVLQQIFDECNATQKRIILSRFISQVICRKLLIVTGQQEKQFVFSLLNMISAIMKISIKYKAISNDLLYIVRQICQQSQVLAQFTINIGSLNIVFNALTEKEINSEQKTFMMLDFDDRSVELRKIYYGKENDDENIYNSIQTEMKMDRKQRPFRNNSKQESWFLMTFLYTLSLDRVKLQSLPLIEKILDEFKNNFEEVSISKLATLIDNCNNAKWAHVISNFFIKICENNLRRTEKLIDVFKKAFNDFDSVKFRPFLLILYHFSFMQDEITLQREELIIDMLKTGLSSNQKYFSELDILHQWIIKMASCNKLFKQEIQGTEFIDEIIEQVQKNKKPSFELLKKQKNPSFGRLLYKLHGLTISSEMMVYDDLCHKKLLQFQQLLQKKFIPEEDLEEPPYMQRYKPGDQILYFNNLNWMECKVEEYEYGVMVIKFQSMHGEQQYRVMEYEQKIRPKVQKREDCQMEIE